MKTPGAYLDEALEGLSQVYTPGGVLAWISGPIRSLGGECPFALIIEGRGEEVVTRIQQLIDGTFV